MDEPAVLTPPRRRGVEILDDPGTDPAVRERSLRDVARSNRWLGGLRAAAREVEDALRDLGPGAIVIDVGTGFADIPARIALDAAAGGQSVTTIGVDRELSLLRTARGRLTHAVCADALHLPFAPGSADVALCSQLLHHFEMSDAGLVVRELHRVARRTVVVSDLRRSRIAAAGFWLVSFFLHFHHVTRHDGVVSVFRGFTAAELGRLVASATGTAPRVRRRLGFRLTARWSRDGQT